MPFESVLLLCSHGEESRSATTRSSNSLTYFVSGLHSCHARHAPLRLFRHSAGRPGRIPIHRTHVGTLILADLIGARSCIFIKDEKGLYSDDPKKNPEARVHRGDRRKAAPERDQDDLIIERPCLEILQNSRSRSGKFRSSMVWRKGISPRPSKVNISEPSFIRNESLFSPSSQTDSIP